jgi:transposase-like protein
MSKKPRRKFTIEQKQQAVNDYLTGKKSAVAVASELDVTVSLIYKWKADLELKSKNKIITDLTEQGYPRAAAIKIQQQQAEIEAYQKKVAEQSIIIDLLKKLRTRTSSQPESELTGLIKTTNKLAQRRKL